MKTPLVLLFACISLAITLTIQYAYDPVHRDDCKNVTISYVTGTFRGTKGTCYSHHTSPEIGGQCGFERIRTMKNKCWVQYRNQTMIQTTWTCCKVTLL